jgi:hypothetical protein
MLARIAKHTGLEPSDDDDEEKAIPLAAIAWNAASLPEEKLIPRLMESVGHLAGEDPEAAAGLLALLAAMVRRKLDLYPGDRRMIVSYRFSGPDENRKLQVISTPPR